MFTSTRFAGSGVHLSRTTQEFVPGSPLHALAVEPPFVAYHLIDIGSAKAAQLRHLIGERSDVTIYEGDCNQVLLESVFPTVRFRDYRRGLCILDPYGLHLDWSVIEAAGQSKAIDMFLNFPVADMNRNVLWQNPEGVDEADEKRMSTFWGDDTWREMAYRTDRNLFGMEEKVSNEEVVETFRDRLRRVAGFARVPKPMPMRNSRGAVVYYLFFASQKDTAERIVTDIFGKYGSRGGA
ncbi:MAG: three-Cys-motif partner protein TcmP [Candidatus Acidiferrales bacterium]